MTMELDDIRQETELVKLERPDVDHNTAWHIAESRIRKNYKRLMRATLTERQPDYGDVTPPVTTDRISDWYGSGAITREMAKALRREIPFTSTLDYVAFACAAE